MNGSVQRARHSFVEEGARRDLLEDRTLRRNGVVVVLPETEIWLRGVWLSSETNVHEMKLPRHALIVAPDATETIEFPTVTWIGDDDVRCGGVVKCGPCGETDYGTLSRIALDLAVQCEKTRVCDALAGVLSVLDVHLSIYRSLHLSGGVSEIDLGLWMSSDFDAFSGGSDVGPHDGPHDGPHCVCPSPALRPVDRAF